MRGNSSAIVIFIIVLGLLFPDGAAAEFAFALTGFEDELIVDDLPSPTALAWLPPDENDDLLIATRGGGVFRFADPGPAQQLLNLNDTICSGGETGLLGIAVHPDFEGGQRFIYVYYTDRKANGDCDLAKNRANRLSRFTMNDQNQLVNEQVLIDNISTRGGNHNGGDIQFGADGNLYVSVGDAGRDLRTGETQDDNRNARRLDLLNGKILRITPEGGIPDDNPFLGPGTSRCRASGGAGLQGDGVSVEKKSKRQKRKAHKRRRQKRSDRRQATVCQEIFATGLRNPYRMAFDPNGTPDAQRFFVNDVGGNGFEEVNAGQAGADYGWNVREGPCPINDISNNCAGSSQFVDPIFAYRTGGSLGTLANCRTITGGAFSPGSPWPGDYLFADFGCDGLFALTGSGSGADVDLFASGEGASHLAFGPDGHLYYTTFSDGGQVRRIVSE